MSSGVVRTVHSTNAVMHRRPRSSSRGFTLIELMTVVVIVGVLAVLATLAYGKFIAAGRVAEATSMVGNIRGAQEAYKAEFLQYIDVSSSFSSTAFYPKQSANRTKTNWGDSTTSSLPDNAKWLALGARSDGPVMFGYLTKAYAPGTSPPSTSPGALSPAVASWPAYTTSADWAYIIVAQGDLTLDATGKVTYVLGSSYTGEIYIENEGE